MRKLVRESVSFERGGDPRKTMKVGKLERIKEKYNKDGANGSLVSASIAGNLEDVKFLVQIGADMDDFGTYSLEWAARKGHLGVVKYLVEYGADVNTTIDGQPLRWATMNGHLDIVKFLVEQGVNTQSDYKQAFYIADNEGYQDIVDYLKSKMKE